MQPSPNKLSTHFKLIAQVSQYVLQTTDQECTSIEAIANHLKQVSRKKYLPQSFAMPWSLQGLPGIPIILYLRNIETL